MAEIRKTEEAVKWLQEIGEKILTLRSNIIKDAHEKSDIFYLGCTIIRMRKQY